ncbi:MAG: Tetratricopeptide 2 repeat protein [Deltaproteobacteria bacterium]|nr:Tetratricopeptide 2 repeat protein [Deltaproteobacteria bacterium]
MSKRSARLIDKSRAGRRREQSTTANRPGFKTTALWPGAIFVVALLIRLIYLFQIESIPLFYHLAGDGRTYDEWAQRIAAGDWLGQGVFYQAPLYPYFLGVLQLVFGHNLWLIRFLQIILGSLSCALVFLVGEKLFSRPVGTAAGLLLAGYAPAIFFDALIEKSILDLTLLSLFMFVLLNGADNRWRKWFGAGALLGLLGLSRENALILVPVVSLWLWFQYSHQPFALRARWLGLFCAGVLLVLGPVGLRNLIVGGEFKLTTSQFGANFYIGNNPAADGTYGSIRNLIGETQLEGPDAKRLAERRLGRELTPGEVSSYWSGQALAYIKTQPAAWLRLLGLKWLLVWNAREVEDSDDFYIYQDWSWLLAGVAWFSHFGVLAPLAAIGVLFTLRQWRQLWLLYATILSLAASVAAFYVFGRYRFPLVPLLGLFAGVGVVETVRFCQQRAWRRLVQPFIVLIAVGVVINWPLRKVSGAGAAGYNNLANAYAKQGKVGEAIKTAERALEVEPDYGVAHYNLGNLYAQQGKFTAAKRHFEEALRLLPNYAEAHSNYGQLRAESGDIEAGMKHFEKAVALSPTLSRAQLNLGVALAKQGKTEAAIEPLKAAARLNTESPQASFFLGSVYAAQNRYTEAEESFNQALRIDGSFALAHQRLAELFEVQGNKEAALRHYRETARLMRQSSPAR